MKKIKMTKLEQVLLVVAVAVISMYFFVKQSYDPLTKDIKKLVKQNNTLVAAINDLKNEPDNTQNILRSIKKMTPEIEQLKAEYREIETMRLTPPDKVEEAVMKINETAANNALVVRALSPEEDGDDKLPAGILGEQKLFKRKVYHMKISGDFIDFYAFFKEVAGFERLVTLTSLNITRRDDAGRVDVDMYLLI